MNAISRLAAAALTLATGAAFAQEAVYETPQPATSSVSRASVIAEAADAKSRASLRGLDGLHNAAKPASSKRMRDEVRTETLAAIASGEIRALTGESNAFELVGAATATPVHQMAQATR